MKEQLSTVEYLQKLRTDAPADVLKLSLGMPFQEQRKYVSVRIPDDVKFDCLELYHLTDVQWGALTCLRKRYIEYRDWILAEPCRFALFGGDMINCATLLSKADPWDDDSPPLEQIYDFVAATMPMRHRILGYVGGNHERHTRPTLGGSAGSVMATNLEIPYSDGQQFIDIYYGDWKPFKISLWHGTGGAITDGAVAQKLARFMAQGDSHLYLMGHVHLPMVRPNWRVQRNVKGKLMGLQKIYGCVSSSFMDFWGSYGEMKGLSPSDVLMARCILYPDGHVEVTLR